MSYDYSKSKLVVFTSNQYTDKQFMATINSNIGSAFYNMSNFLKTENTGYILIPQNNYNDSVEDSAGNLSNVKEYGITELVNPDGTLNENAANICINEMYIFIKKLLELKHDVNLWIGTPEIHHKNYSSMLNTIGGVSNVLNGYKAYVQKLKKTLGDNVWKNNIIGIYYNQESFYGTGNANTMLTDSTTDFYRQYKLINDFSYYIHNELGENNNKSLIWIPYLVTSGSEDDQAAKFKEIGTMINKTTCFDCVYVQPHLGVLYNTYKGTVFYTSDDKKNNNIEKDPRECYEEEKKSGILNISAIRNSMNDNIMRYRNGVVVNSDIQNYVGNCLIGAEYEYNENGESSYPDEALFSEYQKFDDCVNKKPLAFYWQGNVNRVCQMIDEKYDARNYNNIKWTSPSGDDFSNSFISDGGEGLKTRAMFTSDFKLRKNDKISVELGISLDIEHVSEYNVWEAEEDYIVQLNGSLNTTIDATAGSDNGEDYFRFNGEWRTLGSYDVTEEFIISDDMDGQFLSIYVYANPLSVHGSSMGYNLSYRISINNRIVVG